MRAWRLRRVEALTHARDQAAQSWRDAGHCAGVGRLAPQAGYLGFCAGHWCGLIEARQWLHQTLPSLRGWLTHECSVSHIAELFQAVAQPLPPLAVLPGHELTGIELVNAAALPTHDLPWLDTARGRVWVTRLPRAPVAHGRARSLAWLRDLPLRLELLLGISRLGHGRLARLENGDVLRIEQRLDHCRVGQHGLGIFTFTKEGLRMQITTAEEGIPHEAELAALPIRLEFLLASHDLDLGTLAQIVAGQLIPLASDAAQQVEVRANGKLLARGELVQLDEQLAVEVHEVYPAP